jgi:hypothetical protein
MQTGLLMRDRKFSGELGNPPVEPVYGPLSLKMSPMLSENPQGQMNPQAQALIELARNPSLMQNPYVQMLLQYFR